MSQPVAPVGFPRLAELLFPCAAEAFFEDHWERRPLLVRAEAKSVRALLLAADWRSLLRSVPAGSASLELLRRGGYRRLEDAAEAERALDEGHSLRLFHVERVWPEMERLCAGLAQELGFAVSANLYVTPSGCQGLGAHADDHDVFVVQIASGKDWRVYGSPFPLPLEHRPPLIFEEGSFRRNHRGATHGARPHPQAELGEPALRETLRPGDLLYLPRGAVHWASAEGGTSAHVTIGVHATTWADLAALAVSRAALERASLRETLPPGATRTAPDGEWLRRELQQRTEGMFGPRSALDALEELAARFLTSGRESVPPAGPGAKDAFDPERAYSLGPRVLVVQRGETLALRRFQRGSEDVLLPAAFAPAIGEMRERERFRLPELRRLTPRSALVLGRELHRHGLLLPAD